MSTHLVLANFTEQGIQQVKVSAKRLEAVKAMASAVGGEVKAFYLTIGEYDMTFVLDMPNDKALATFLLAVASAGNIRTTSLRAFTEDEFEGIVDDLP